MSFDGKVLVEVKRGSCEFLWSCEEDIRCQERMINTV